MHLRQRQTTYSFKELNDQNKTNFFNHLATSAELEVIYLLSQQYSIDPENIIAIQNYLNSLPTPYKHSKRLSGLTQAIKRTVNMPQLLNNDYSKLNREDQQQFIIALLIANSKTREKTLRTQSDVNVIIEYLRNTNALVNEFYCQFATFASLLNQLIKIANEKNPTAKDVIVLTQKELELASALKKIPKLFVDETFFKSEISNAVITPQGTTYERKDIIQWIFLSQRDPLDRSTLKANDLIANHLFTRIKNLFDEPIIPIWKLYQLLHCPFSGKILEDPVVAADGNTYSHAWIKAYLAEHKNELPNKRDLQTHPLYPNRFLTEFLNLPEIKHLLSYYSEMIRKQMGAKLCRSADQIDNYIYLRLKEPRYQGNRFGFTQWEKIFTAAQFNNLIHFKQNQHLFFAKTNLRPLKQGRFQPIFTQAMIEYDNQIRMKP